MARLLLAAALSVALLGAILVGWLVLRTPPPREAAPPGAPAGGQDAGASTSLRAAGGAEEARRESTAEVAVGSDSARAPGGSVQAGFRFRVAVAEPDGTPVAGARVEVLARGRDEAQTDAAGIAPLVADIGAEQVELRVEAEGYAHARRRVWIDELVEVTLHRAIGVSGRVLDASTQRPVPGARVWFEDGHEGCEPRGVESAADGSYRLEEIPLETRVTIAAAAEGYADGRARFQLLAGGGTDGLDVPLERSAGMRLRVVDFADQRPIPGARLLNLADLPPADERGEIDAGRLIGESSESTWIRLAAPGYCRLDRQIATSEATAEGLIVVPMVRGARFEGLVASAGGAPIAGARVRLGNDQRDLRGRDRGALPQLEGWPPFWVLNEESDEAVATDEQGRFVSPSVPPSSSGWRLRVSAEGYGRAEVDPGPAAAPGRSSWVEVELEELRAGTLRGRLTLNGQPVAGTVSWQGPTLGGQAPTDPGGGFLLERVEPGPVSLRGLPRVQGRGGFGTLLDDQGPRVELPPGGELEQDVELLLPLATISGRVRTGRGDGLAGVEVVASQPDERASFETISRAGGDFELEVPDLPTPWTLFVRGRWRIDPVQAPAGARGVELVLTELGRVRVRLLDAADGRPLRGFQVAGSVPGEVGSRSLATTWRSPADPAGWIEVEAPSGSLELFVSPMDRTYAPVRASIVVPPAGAPPVRVELDTSRGHEVTLVLAEDSNMPARRSQLYLLDEADAARLPEWTGENEFVTQLFAIVGDARVLRGRRISFGRERRTTLRGLPPGRYRLVDCSGGRFAPAEIELPRDGSAALELSWEGRR